MSFQDSHRKQLKLGITPARPRTLPPPCPLLWPQPLPHPSSTACSTVTSPTPSSLPHPCRRMEVSAHPSEVTFSGKPLPAPSGRWTGLGAEGRISMQARGLAPPEDGTPSKYPSIHLALLEKPTGMCWVSPGTHPRWAGRLGISISQADRRDRMPRMITSGSCVRIRPDPLSSQVVLSESGCCLTPVPDSPSTCCVAPGKLVNFSRQWVPLTPSPQCCRKGSVS